MHSAQMNAGIRIRAPGESNTLSIARIPHELDETRRAEKLAPIVNAKQFTDFATDQLVDHDVGHRVFRFALDRIRADFFAIALRSALVELLAGSCLPSASGARKIFAVLGLSAYVYRCRAYGDNVERIPELVAELMRLGVDVFVVPGAIDARRVQQRPGAVQTKRIVGLSDRRGSRPPLFVRALNLVLVPGRARSGITAPAGRRPA